MRIQNANMLEFHFKVDTCKFLLNNLFAILKNKNLFLEKCIYMILIMDYMLRILCIMAYPNEKCLIVNQILALLIIACCDDT